MTTREYTPTELALMAKLGLVPQDFEPKPMTDEERMNEIEDAILELAEIIGGA